MDFIAVGIEHERKDLNSQLQSLAGFCNCPNQRLFESKSRWLDKKSRAELPAVVSIAVFQCSSGICFYCRFRRVVRNVYTHRFDPAKLGKLVNSTPELFARTKAELLAFAAVLEH